MLQELLADRLAWPLLAYTAFAAIAFVGSICYALWNWGEMWMDDGPR